VYIDAVGLVPANELADRFRRDLRCTPSVRGKTSGSRSSGSRSCRICGSRRPGVPP